MSIEFPNPSHPHLCKGLAIVKRTTRPRSCNYVLVLILFLGEIPDAQNRKKALPVVPLKSAADTLVLLESVR